MEELIKGRILIVDDDPMFTRTLRGILELNHYQCSHANSVETAMTALTAEQPDVALVDLKLGQESGLQILEYIQSSMVGTECILLTGYASIESAVSALNHGAYSYLQKPYDIDNLLQTIRHAIHKIRIETGLKRSELKYRILTEESPTGIYQTNPEGDCIFVNKHWQKTAGLTMQQVLGSDWLTAIHPDDKDQVASDWTDFINGYQDWDNIYRFLSPDGRITWVHGIAKKNYDENGRLENILGINLDITARIKAEQALGALQEFNAGIIEHSPIGISLRDKFGTLLVANPAWHRIWGKSPEDAAEDCIPRKALNFDERDSYLGDNLSQVKRVYTTGGEHLVPEVKLREGPAGKAKWISQYFKAISDAKTGDVKNVIIITTDITDVKSSNFQLEASRDNLRSLASKLSQVEEAERRKIATWLHDGVSQLLAVIKIKLNLFGQKHADDKVTSFLSELSPIVDEAIDQTRSLTFELSPPILYELGLSPAIQWLVDGTHKKQDIKISYLTNPTEIDVNEEISVIVFQTVRELLNNIIKHSQATEAEITLTQDEAFTVVNVSDNGIGSKAGGDKSQDPETGFGLFNIKERLIYLGGHFYFSSSPGKGTRVSVKIPR